MVDISHVRRKNIETDVTSLMKLNSCYLQTSKHLLFLTRLATSSRISRGVLVQTLQQKGVDYPATAMGTKRCCFMLLASVITVPHYTFLLQGCVSSCPDIESIRNISAAAIAIKPSQTRMSKSNQGNLEALAALCGTQSDAQMKDSKKQESREGSSSGAAIYNACNNNNVSVPQASNDSSNKANQQNPVQGLTQPQWQQALAAVSGLQQTHQNNLGSGMSPGLAQSLLLSGLSTQGIPTATAEQLALQRYLQQHVSISAAQQAVLSHSLANYGDPNQALIMALAGKTQQFQQGGNGEFTMCSWMGFFNCTRVLCWPLRSRWYALNNFRVHIFSHRLEVQMEKGFSDVIRTTPALCSF